MAYRIPLLCRLHHIAPLVVTLACAPAIAAPARDPGLEAQMLKVLQRDLANSFVLDDKLALEPALRAEADEISAAHLARMDKVMPLWLAEERDLLAAQGKGFVGGDTDMALWARMYNELALWQIEPGDAAYENATLAVLKESPRICQVPGDSRYTDFASRILRIQAMPAAQRAAALTSERQLLARWGQARSGVAPWPDPLPQDAALAHIKRGQSGGARPALALPPMVAMDLLGQQQDYAAMPRMAQCVLQQWWLQESLRQGATPAAALNAFRYGSLISIAQRYPEWWDVAAVRDAKTKPAEARQVYPRFARMYHVTGTTTMRVQYDSAGKARQVSVASREIEVPGIRGIRPIAFEPAFDKAAINYLLASKGIPTADGATPALVPLVWKREPEADAPSTTPPGNSQ